MNNSSPRDSAESKHSEFKYWLLPMFCSLLLSLGLIALGFLFVYRLCANEVTDPVVLRDAKIFTIGAASIIVAGFVNLIAACLWRKRAVTALAMQVFVVIAAALILAFVQYRANLPN